MGARSRVRCVDACVGTCGDLLGFRRGNVAHCIWQGGDCSAASLLLIIDCINSPLFSTVVSSHRQKKTMSALCTNRSIAGRKGK